MQKKLQLVERSAARPELLNLPRDTVCLHCSRLSPSSESNSSCWAIKAQPLRDVLLIAL